MKGLAPREMLMPDLLRLRLGSIERRTSACNLVEAHIVVASASNAPAIA
jgi:hypothetical protein